MNQLIYTGNNEHNLYRDKTLTSPALNLKSLASRGS